MFGKFIEVGRAQNKSINNIKDYKQRMWFCYSQHHILAITPLYYILHDWN